MYKQTGHWIGVNKWRVVVMSIKDEVTGVIPAYDQFYTRIRSRNIQPVYFNDYQFFIDRGAKVVWNANWDGNYFSSADISPEGFVSVRLQGYTVGGAFRKTFDVTNAYSLGELPWEINGQIEHVQQITDGTFQNFKLKITYRIQIFEVQIWVPDPDDGLEVIETGSRRRIYWNNMLTHGLKRNIQ